MAKQIILVADDDQTTVHVVSAALQAKGFTVVTASDSMQATMIALRSSPAAIVLDIQMPGGSGIEVVKKLRKSSKTQLTPILILTGSADPAIEASARAAGADEYLQKPVNAEVLLRSLAKVLEEPAT